MDQPSGVPAGKLGDTGGRETGALSVGFSRIGLKVTGPDVFLQ